MDYKYMAVKLLVGFIVLLFYIRISGKSQLAPLTPSDQVGNMVIGAMVSTTIVSPNMDIIASAALVLMWGALQIFVRFMKFRSEQIAEFFDGTSTLLIKDGVLLKEGFVKGRISILDFETHIHEEGLKSISEVKNAWLDNSGVIVIDKKGEKSSSNVLIYDGKIFSDTLKEIGVGKGELLNKLREIGFTKKEILCAEYYDRKLVLYLNDGYKRVEDFDID